MADDTNNTNDIGRTANMRRYDLKNPVTVTHRAAPAPQAECDGKWYDSGHLDNPICDKRGGVGSHVSVTPALERTDCCACAKFGAPITGYGKCPCQCHALAPHVTHGDVRKCIEGDHSECSGETAGEMTPEQWQRHDHKKYLYHDCVTCKDSWNLAEVEAYAKQRVEQVQRQRVARPFVADKMTDEHLQAVGMTRAAHKRVQASFDAIFDCADSWQKRSESAETKVSALERERDAARQERDDEQQLKIGQANRAEAAELKLEKMREALRLAQHVMHSAPKQGWDKWREATEAAERLIEE